MKNIKASYISKGGLLIALGIIFVYLSTILPTNKLFFLGIASCIIPISVINMNIQISFFIYFCTSLLTFLLIGPKGTVLAYIIFFGIYGLIKLYIEKLHNLILEIILKLIFFNFSIFIIFLIYKLLFTQLPKINLSLTIFILILEAIFLIYDYVMTLFISYSKNFFR